MKRLGTPLTSEALQKRVAPERSLCLGDARGVHAAGRALERISIAFGAVRIARSAADRELACGM